MSEPADHHSNATKPAESNPTHPAHLTSPVQPNPAPNRTPKNTPVRHPCLNTPPSTSPLLLGASSLTRPAIRTPQPVSLVEYLREEPRTLYIDPHLFPSGLEPGDVVEVSGPANCGKSMLALSLIATALLPAVWCGVQVGGCEAGVLYIDCEQHFSIFQLVNLMYRKVKIRVKLARGALKEHRRSGVTDTAVIANIRDLTELLRYSTSILKDKIQDMVQGRLEGFHYIGCLQSAQYPIALGSIDEHLAKNSDVCLLVVDSLSAFSWHDWIYKANGKFVELKKYYDKLLSVLLASVKKYKVALIAVKQALFLKMCEDNPRKSVEDEEEVREESVVLDDDMEEGDVTGNMMENEYLGYTWVSGVTCQVIMSKVRVGKGLSSVSPGNKDTKNVDLNSEVKQLFSAEVIRNKESVKLQFVVTEEGLMWQ
ncbi:DNA repair protein XRCC2 homolog [Portunus trituberculatus]|uniref:DNA repair protein XRCC2 homolog n=1 Tax=Portunus trituberculatus TaxID=210409 RepID=UPI001E1CB116|nr:DNA repair protein XRCC2 homolog [Portunus trituberculatus]